MIEVGLDYVTLGQSLDTFSGGERQRLKLAVELQGKGQIYVFDEPTTGLHMRDVDKLLKLLNSIVEKGSTVIVIEHNLEVISQADWVIDIGPQAGEAGGEVVFEGTTDQLVKSKSSVTGKFLSNYLTNTCGKN